MRGQPTGWGYSPAARSRARGGTMAAGNRIALTKVALKPASDMAGAATELDRIDVEMQGVVDRYNARMLQQRDQIQANLRDVPIPADAKVAAARTQMSRADHETRNEAR